MALTRIKTDSITANAITTEKISSTVELGGPKISNVQIANSSWSQLDDTAVSLDGGYILINGSGFVNGASVIINGTPVVSATVANSSQIRAEVASANAGTYVAYVVNPDGGTAIGVNALTYSATPTWVTSSTLTAQEVDVAISIQLEASNATSYALQAGSSLPANTTLASNGLFSGTVSGIETETVYSFTVVATDAENQDSPRTFSVTVTAIVADEYFNSTVLLLQADGTSNTSHNKVLTDSSNNAVSVSRYGNITQGSFSPLSPTGWSVYFDGTGDFIQAGSSSNLTLGTQDFTISFWMFPTASATSASGIFGIGPASTGALVLFAKYPTFGDNVLTLNAYGGNSAGASQATNVNQWNHVAISRASGTVSVYLNGTRVINTTFNDNLTGADIAIGRSYYNANQEYFNGYIADFRIVKGTALYSGTTISVPTTPSTAVSGTQFLTCQSNRFVDNSTNAFSITKNGDAKITAFSPFAPSVAYTPATHGGSIYVDSSGDFLTIESGDPVNFGTGDFTIEWWVYRVTAYSSDRDEMPMAGSGTSSIMLGMQNGTLNFGVSETSWNITSSIAIPLDAWAHCAIARSGSTVTMYINGASAGSATMSTNFTGASYFQIGRRNSSTVTNKSDNYLSGFRVVKGTAVYTSTFTPPTSAPTNIANTSLLLNFTGAGIYDATSKNVLETIDGAQVRTDVKKYGTGSMYFDGSGDYLYQPNNALYALGSGNFTIEFWFNPLALDGDRLIVDMRVSGSDTLPAIYSTGTNIAYYTAGAQRIAAGTLTTSTWQHIALVRYSGSTKLYINGTAVGSAYSDSNSYGLAPLRVGIGWNGSNPTYGYIDDLRITRGVARYTSNFTAPDAAFPVQ